MWKLILVAITMAFSLNSYSMNGYMYCGGRYAGDVQSVRTALGLDRMEKEIADVIAEKKNSQKKIAALKIVSETMKKCSNSIDNGEYGISENTALLREVDQEFSNHISTLWTVYSGMANLILNNNNKEADQARMNLEFISLFLE